MRTSRQGGRDMRSSGRVGSWFVSGSAHGSPPRSDPSVASRVATGPIVPICRSHPRIDRGVVIPVVTGACGRSVVLDNYLSTGISAGGWRLLAAAASHPRSRFAHRIAAHAPRARREPMCADRLTAHLFHARGTRAIVIGAPRNRPGQR